MISFRARGGRPLETEEISWLHKMGNRIPWKCPSLWARKWGSYSTVWPPRNWREEVEIAQQHTSEERLQAKHCSAAPRENRLLCAPHFSNPSPPFHLPEPETHLKKGVNWEFYLILNCLHPIKSPSLIRPIPSPSLESTCFGSSPSPSNQGHCCFSLELESDHPVFPDLNEIPLHWIFHTTARTIFLEHKSDHVCLSKLLINTGMKTWKPDSVLFKQSGFL